MALVTREAQALESRLEWELASRCSNYQQLLILKKNQGNENGIQSAASCQGMTPSERLIWYRANQPAVELDAERCAQSSNYGDWRGASRKVRNSIGGSDVVQDRGTPDDGR